jgi:hypothetical protein
MPLRDLRPHPPGDQECGGCYAIALSDALEDILTEHKPLPQNIARVDVATYRFAANMREPDPINYFAAKYSLPHAAAASILRGNAGITRSPKRRFEIPRARRPAGESLFARTRRSTPACRDSSQHGVTVTLSDGRQVPRLRQAHAATSRKESRRSPGSLDLRGVALRQIDLVAGGRQRLGNSEIEGALRLAEERGGEIEFHGCRLSVRVLSASRMNASMSTRS